MGRGPATALAAARLKAVNVMVDPSAPPVDQPRTVPRQAAGSGYFWPAVVISALLVVGSAVVAVALPARPALLTVRLIMIFCLLLGGGTCVVTGLRRRGAERAWRLLVAGMVLGIGAGAAEMFPAMASRGPPVPRQDASSLAYLIPQAFGLAGVLCYPTDPFDLSLRPPGRGRDRRWYVITIMDGLIVAGAVTLLAWITILEDAIAAWGPLGDGPIYSIVLSANTLIIAVVVILVVVFRQPRSGGGLSLLIMGLLTVTASIASYMAVVVRGGTDVPRLLDLLLIAGPLLVGLAALAPETSRPGRAAVDGSGDTFVPSRRRRWHAMLPYLPLTAAGVATLLELSREDIAQQEEIWALLALLLIALLRQMTTMSDNIRLLGQVEEKQRQLHYQAFHDPLTGLANRALFTERLDSALRRRDLGAGRLAVLFCDLDGFKRVNDEFGHAAGDDLLRVTARRLAGCVRPADTVARLGGDEFAILLDADAEDPGSVGRRLAAAVRAPIRLADTTFTVAASTGLVVVDPATGPVTADALLHRADLAMYAAKAQGDGRQTVYTPDLAVPRSGSALRAALDAAARGEPADGRLAVIYRPIIDLTTATPVAHEARLAWAHPDLGATRPLPADDALGLVPALDRILLRAACRADGSGRPLPVHVTISARRAGQPTLVDDVAAALRAADLPPAGLVLQIRPTPRAAGPADFGDVVSRVRASGVRIGLAEIGAPDTLIDAAIGILGSAPVDIVTVHSDLTATWTAPGRDDPAAALARTGLATLIGLGITVVADGVDGPATAARLRERGCRLAFGDPCGRALLPSPLPHADAADHADPRHADLRHADRCRSP
ncbi:diguanylate cyclase [Frankia sp. Hr75.2]|uniref:diguanylate cyclase domain-containing protein n=1 Tax=Parafrankia sp. Ea1.12 TaxID=573499 RepID=UPI000DA4FF0E|nr:diguanylate cyclase [Parafrankia sp. Ea1.12]CAI7979507.1 diguanylate cyclase [Frankia sp. Hr75.2]SQD98117.1 Diguanylate cyclase/phosphodiesterase [Parafrankia sp. Ea1.12]